MIRPTPSVPGRRSASGFTLLEVSATMGILAILAGGIFSITTASFELTSELSEFQKRNVLKKRFVELCRMNLEDIPGHARVEFKTAESGYATYLSIVEHPFAFTFGGNTANVHRVILETDVGAGGYLRTSLLYLSEEENLLYEQENLDPAAVQRRVVILRRLRHVTWEFYDTSRQEWLDRWEQPRNPTLIALTLAMENETTPERSVFWIPPEKAVSVSGGGSRRDEDEEEEEEEDEDETEADSESDAEPPVRAP